MQKHMDIGTLRAGTTAWQPFRVYTALLTQAGVGAPVPTVLLSTMIGPIVWAYVGIGIYTGTLVGAFTVGKTWFKEPVANLVVAGPLDIKLVRTSANVVTLTTDLPGGGGGTDGVLTDASIEIRVYP